MAHLQYFDYEGFGQRMRKDVHYSQAVRVGDMIELSGQGGWDRLTESIPTDIGLQVDQAYENVEHALRVAGASKGWQHVYKVRCYVTSLDDECVTALVRNRRKWCPNHQPLLTTVVVKGLAFGMGVEIEVAAHVA